MASPSPSVKRQLAASSSPSSSSSATLDDQSDFCEAGHHSAVIGEVYGGRFRSEGRLGQGQFSTVWLCRDVKSGQDAALKVYKSVVRYIEYAKEEVQILEAVKMCDFASREARDPRKRHPASGTAADCVVKLLEHFTHDLPGCCHPCLALEALGPSLLEVAQSCRRDQLPWDLLFAAIRDSLRGLDLLHRGCNIIHTDIKPENILARIDAAALSEMRETRPCGKRRRTSAGGFSSGFSSVASFCFRPKYRKVTGKDVISAREGAVTFVLADLGNSCFVDRQVSDCISTCEYKAPEVLLGAGYGTPADLWSLACTLYEAATGRYLLDPRRVLARPAALDAADREAAQRGSSQPGCPARGSPAVPAAEEHIAQLVELQGMLPKPMLQRSKFANQALRQDDNEQWLLRSTGIPLSGLLRSSLQTRLEEHLQGPEVQPLAQLMDAMLSLDPARRADARALLEGAAWLWAQGEA